MIRSPLNGWLHEITGDSAFNPQAISNLPLPRNDFVWVTNDSRLPAC
jgi:hypothetical protein